MDIAGWLRSLGLEQYAPAFRDNDIEAETLSQLTAEDLIALGVTSVGHRRKVLTAVEALRAGPASVARVQPVMAGSASPRAERRQLTVMFIDLVGSTALSQGLDPEEMRDVIRAFQSTVSAEIARYDGMVAKLMGDAVLAYFGWPRAHEDDAERAVRSGLAAAAATAGLSAPGGEALAARVGIATGLVVVGDLVGEGSAQEEAVVGDTPNLAARLQSVAESGSVVIAEGTHRLVTGLFESVDLGNQTLKGFAADVRAWRVVGEAGSESRFEARQGIASPLVGREEELALVLERWRMAREGTGQVVLLSGEAGIGKSRLIAALDERFGSEPYGRVRYFCSPYHVNSALHPVITQLERSAGFSRDDGAGAKLDKLEALLRRLPPGGDQTSIPLLATLLSIDAAGRFAALQLTPSVQKARTFALLVQQIEAQAAHQPVVIFVEDAHWMDPTTGEWLDALIDRLSASPILLIVTSRPGFQPRWMNRSHVTTLSLGRLASEEGAAIIERVAGGKALPSVVMREILANTEGVPLFVEELTKTVLDSGLLVEAGDRYVLSGPLPALAIPSTLQDSLMARLDRLASGKEVAQIGACIGRSFEHRLLAAVTNRDDVRLAGILEELEESELVFRRGVPPEATYTFKHALVRDTAYQSLLKTRRQQIHAKIASTLEGQFQEIVEAEPETLAHHYTVAGLGEQAVVSWLKAGQRALKRSANLEAAAHLNKGLELVGSLPDSEDRLRKELSLQTALGTATMAAKGFGAPEVLQAFSRARALAETLGDKTQLFGSMRGESAYRTISGNLRAAEKLGHQCQLLGLELAQASGNSEFTLEADHQLWGINYYLGDYDASDHYAGRGLAAYDHERHRHLAWGYTGHDPGVCCRTFSAWILCMRGQSDQAVQRSSEAVTLAERDLHPLSMAQAQIGLSYVHLLRCEPALTRKWAERAIALCTEFVMPLLVSQARVYLGWALSRQGHAEEGMSRMREGIAGIRKTGADMGMAYYLCILARTCGESGKPGEGLALLEEAFDNLAKIDSKYQLPELLCVKGELLSLQNPRGDASETCFRQSLTAAREQRAPWSELRSGSRLARLFVGQGRERKARDLLAPICAGFSEGFDTHDFKEAKHLLETLSPQTLEGDRAQ